MLRKHKGIHNSQQNKIGKHLTYMCKGRKVGRERESYWYKDEADRERGKDIVQRVKRERI